MASAGTLLSDLDTKTPVFTNKDDDLVNKILADMNMPSSSNPVMNVPPPSGNNNRVIYSPNANTTYPMASDPATANAHMIGKDYPNAADFANLMHNSYAPPPPNMTATLVDNTRSNVYTDIIGHIKQPLLVAIIIFIVSLPALNILIGHYMPGLLRIGGDLTTAGILLRATIGGFLFWFIQKILVPFMVL
jgi:hypothetical protein